MPGVHKVELVGQEVVAAHLGVTSQAISNWYKREAQDTALDKPAWGMPAPQLIEFSPGKKPQRCWRRAQLAVWAKWYEKRLAVNGKHVPPSRKRAAA